MIDVRSPAKIDIENLPKIDLHRHLLGSARMTTLWELAKHNGSGTGQSSLESLEKALVRDTSASDLSEYIQPWSYLRSVIRSPEDVRRIAKEAAEDAAGDCVAYVEFRSSLPGLEITDGSLPQTLIPTGDYLAAIRDGFAQVANIVCRLIVSIPRHAVGAAGPKLLDRYADQFFSAVTGFRSELVVGVDLTGIERGWPAMLFKSIFQEARALGLPITIHAGETEGPEEIWAAIDDLGATRIGHGTTASIDARLVEELIRRNVVLEVCPTSGWLTGTLKDRTRHPVIDCELPIPYVICTDNPTLNGTTLSRELYLAAQIAGAKPHSFVQSQYQLAAKAAFVTSQELPSIAA
jgi:adenosine deaminase